MNVHSSIIHNSQKVNTTRCLSMWHGHTADYYTVIKVLTQATTWINPENSILIERSQTQKATYCMSPFTRNVQNRQIYTGKK